MVSTFLDPNFGLDAFPPDKKELVRKTVKELLIALKVSGKSSEELTTKKPSRLDTVRSRLYTFYSDSTLEPIETIDNIDLNLDKFILN